MSKKYPPGVLSRSTPKLAHSALGSPLENGPIVKSQDFNHKILMGQI